MVPTFFCISKGSLSEVFCKKGVLKNFTKFTEKHLCQSLFFNKVTGQNTYFYRTPLVKNSQENTCARISFLVKLQASGRTPLLQNTSWATASENLVFRLKDLIQSQFKVVVVVVIFFYDESYQQHQILILKILLSTASQIAEDLLQYRNCVGLWLLKWCKIQSFLLYMFSFILFMFSLILFVFSHILYIFSLILFEFSQILNIFSLILFVFSHIL